MKDNVCPKCGKPYLWMMTREPKYQLVVFHFKCKDCGTAHNIALTEREFYDIIVSIKNRKEI